MEKYLIIIGILIGLYFIYKYNESLTENLTENFEAAAQSLGGVDDTNAINTLAQIAKNLMAGGVTVPGNMNIQGNLGFPKETTIQAGGRLHVGGEELLYVLNKKGVMIGKEWGGTGDLTVQGNESVGGNLAVGAGLNVGGNQTIGGNLTINGTTNLNNDITIVNGKTLKANGRLHINADENIFLLQKGPTILSKAWGGSGDLVVEGNQSNNGRLTVRGRLFIPKPNIKATDGYDGPGQISGTSSLDDCAQKCIEKAYNTQVAMRANSNGHCWCKDAFVWMHQSNDFDSMITL